MTVCIWQYFGPTKQLAKRCPVLTVGYQFRWLLEVYLELRIIACIAKRDGLLYPQQQYHSSFTENMKALQCTMLGYWTQVHWLVVLFIVAWSSATSTQSNKPVLAAFCGNSLSRVLLWAVVARAHSHMTIHLNFFCHPLESMFGWKKLQQQKIN